MTEDRQQDHHRPQFGNRTLSDPKNVFEHNAWDNVVWDEEQEKEAKQKTDEQLAHTVGHELQEQYEKEAAEFWNSFYGIHQNRFFKDRHWLFTEFPELAPEYSNTESEVKAETTDTREETTGTEIEGCVTKQSDVTVGKDIGVGHGDVPDDNTGDTTEEKVKLCDKGKSISGNNQVCMNGVSNKDIGDGDIANYGNLDSNFQMTDQKLGHEGCGSESPCCKATNQLPVDKFEVKFPGDRAKRRILEVGCGVGNTVFPILQTNNDPDLMVYCCDFSPTAVELVKENADYDAKRCHAFVCDISDDNSPVPFPDGSLDNIILIFVLSAIHPDKMQAVLNRLARFLKPGGRILFRDYGRYDMAQLRFKKGKCLSENFYVRGDGTRVYFFTQDELRAMMTKAGLTEKQNLIDRRLQVNRGKQLKMYRVWIQCKYYKPLH